MELLEALLLAITRPLPGEGMNCVLLAGSSTLSMMWTWELQMTVLFRIVAVLLGYCPVTVTCRQRTRVTCSAQEQDLEFADGGAVQHRGGVVRVLPGHLQLHAAHKGL